MPSSRAPRRRQCAPGEWDTCGAGPVRSFSLRRTMMKRKLLSVAVLAFAAAPAVAQSSQCPGSVNPLSAAQISQDACQQAIDLFQYMAPQLGAAITGGNATLGQGGTLGGL